MKTIYEDENICVHVNKYGRIVITNKQSEMLGVKIYVSADEDGHLEIRSDHKVVKYQPEVDGFNVWLN